jgi:hypothetical protein
MTTTDGDRGNCMDGLTCVCGSVACTSGETGTCYEIRGEGASCGDARGRCVTGTECTGSRCVASDALTKFAACAP